MQLNIFLWKLKMTVKVNICQKIKEKRRTYHLGEYIKPIHYYIFIYIFIYFLLNHSKIFSFPQNKYIIVQQ